MKGRKKKEKEGGERRRRKKNRKGRACEIREEERGGR